MLNFCHACLKPKFSCDKVSADDYGVENLITGGHFWSNYRGFRAERFIAPPVCVTVHFPCNVNIAKVILDPVVGRQKSCGFEILSSSHKVHCSSLIQNTPEKISSSGKYPECFVLIGKEILKEPAVISFYNPFFRTKGHFRAEEFNQTSLTPEKNSVLRHNRGASLSSVSALTVRIVSTVEGSVPALKRLEIWGLPSSNCPLQLQKHIYEIYRKANSPEDNPKVKNTVNKGDNSDKPAIGVKSPCSSLNDKNNSQESNIEIPEDFIDPITCDIMTVPLTLPSGKTIDQFTLDKHINCEALWGRLPNDPFTGVLFNDTKKPVPNVSLKLRIDRFVLNHSSHLKNIPRSLGRAETSVITDTFTPNDSPNPRSFLKTGSKRKYEEEKSIKVSNVKISKFQNIPAKIPKTSFIDLTESHEDKLRHSLDTALLSTLSSLHSFSKSSQGCINNLPSSVKGCTQCQVSNRTLYKLPCLHIICKGCLHILLSTTHGALCPNCSSFFSSKDVIRYNA